MNRLNRLFRGNENSTNSQRNFNNIHIHTHTPQFEGRSNTNINRRVSPRYDSSNYNRNVSPLVSNSDIGNYHSPLQHYNIEDNNRTNNINTDNEIDSLNSISLDPSGQFNELCIANITNSCKFGKHCRFIHGKPCSLCNENVYNPLEDLADQMIEHSKICKKMNLVKKEVKESSTEEEDGESNYTCSICLENIVPPMKFGVLCNCNHYFCYECIKIWRNSQDFSDINNHLKCPLCKTKSQFLIPSKEFPKTKKERDTLITKYKQELANTECKKLRDTNYKYCPYGDNCIYSHYKPDGQYMHFTYMTDANQFISPEEYNQNIFQNDTTGFIQYYNNRLIEEALLVDDGDDFGMHNGVFTNPFYHSDDSLDNDIPYFNNLMPNPDVNPNLGFYSPTMYGSEINNIPLEYMFDDVTNHINTLNLNQFEEESNEDNDNISDINDSEISDYLEEIDEDLNLYYMMNDNRNRNSNITNSPIPSIISGSNNGSTNNNVDGRSPASIFSSTVTYPSPGIPPYRQRRELNSRNRENNNITNHNTNTNINNINSNSNSNISTTDNTNTNSNNNNTNNNNNNNISTENHQNNDQNSSNNSYNDISRNSNNNTENTFNLSLIRNTSSRNYQSNINSLNRSVISHDDYSVQSSSSTLQRILSQEANSNDSFNTFGINDEESHNISQLSLSRNNGIRNTTLTSLTELTNNNSSTSNILNNIGMITDSTTNSNNTRNRSSSNTSVNILNTFGRKVNYSDVSNGYNNSSTNKISGQHDTILEPSSSVNKSSNNQSSSRLSTHRSSILTPNVSANNEIMNLGVRDSHLNSQSSSSNHINSQQSNISSFTRSNKERYTQNHNQYVNDNNSDNIGPYASTVINNNDSNSSIDMSRLNVIRTKEFKGQETDLVHDQSYSYKNYKKTEEDIDSDSSGEIEDVIVRSTSGYVDYAELSDDEFNELYMETKF